MEKKNKAIKDFDLIYESAKIDPADLNGIKGGNVAEKCTNVRIGFWSHSPFGDICDYYYIGLE